MKQNYQEFVIRDWQKSDRDGAAEVIRQVLEEYGLPWQPNLADRDVIEVESTYLEMGGEFWVVEQQGEIVGTAAYQPIARGQNAVEIRKMYLLPTVRGRGLGVYLLEQLEQTIAIKDYQEIWIETATVLKEAVRLYELNNYKPASGVETARCDLVYLKRLQHHQPNKK
ncbi:GNAT family N-acetyltransferase [Waterburya agarophytonicola K14]|uniref:GNAT family N-acetyltransferase n=1 Tax=Waterburya agarophytonicola KI4 TaxID=2874699 RepID=A0A964FKZ6_9CYAN|nr:GNAT family N-acetyltransferase [Waterburya agarophytonicola]MCC0179068.1 GNAT family N-acetyltransferase [Waterburya agarophytonicola KI4]